jgi:hypothetical protein
LGLFIVVFERRRGDGRGIWKRGGLNSDLSARWDQFVELKNCGELQGQYIDVIAGIGKREQFCPYNFDSKNGFWREVCRM